MNNNVIGPSNMNGDGYSFNNMNNTNNMNNVNPPVANNKKGFNKIFLVFLVLVLMAVTGFGGWKLGIMYANNENKETKEEEKVKDDNVKEESKDDTEDKEETKKEENILAKNEKYTFYKEVSTDIDLNGRPVKVLTYFYLDKEVLLIDEEEKNETRYVLRRDVFVQDNKILDGVIADVIEKESDADKTIGYYDFTLDDIDTFNDTTNSDEFLVLYLKDSDRLINGKELITRYDPSVTRAYILNNDGTLLKKIDYSNDIWGLVGIYANKNEIGDRNSVKSNTIYTPDMEIDVKSDYMLYTEGVIDFHDTFIYYVTGDCIEFKEYKLSITDGKVKDEYIKTYKEDVLDVAGGC